MKRFILYFFMLSILAFTGFSCSSDDDIPGWEEETENNENGDANEEEGEIEVTPPSTEDEALVPNSQDLSALSNAVFITFSSSENATVTALSNVTSEINGNHITITSSATEGVNYVLSGITTNGSVTFTSDNKFNLHLNGVGITNPSGAAINSTQKAVSVKIVDNTQNRLIDSSTSEYKAAFYSKGKIDFSGNGTLEVRGKVKHAISSGNGITITSGTIYVKEAASDAIHGDGITITGGTITAYATGEGLDADDTGSIDISGGTLNITTIGIASKAINSDSDVTISGGNLLLQTTGDAYFDTDENDTSSAAAIKCDGNLVIEDGVTLKTKSTGTGGKGINVGGTLTVNGGTITVTTTGGQYKYGSYDTAAKAIKSDGNLTINNGYIKISTSKTEAEGLESKATLTINNGTVIIQAYDDCINASNHIQINGGKVYCYSTTNDGIDSNGTLTITGGVVISSGTTSPEEGFDCDQNTFKITGGILIGTGGSTSTPTSSVSTQQTLIWGTSGTSGKLINITSSDGTNIMTYKIPRTYNSMTLLYSSSDLKTGTTYKINTGGSITGYSDEFYGLYTGGNYSGGTQSTTFAPSSSSKVTSVGNTGGPANPVMLPTAFFGK